MFIRAARATADGTVQEHRVSGRRRGDRQAGMPEIVAAIEAAAPSAAGKITLAGDVGPNLPEVSGEAVAGALGGFAFTPLAEGVAATIELFRAAAAPAAGSTWTGPWPRRYRLKRRDARVRSPPQRRTFALTFR